MFLRTVVPPSIRNLLSLAPFVFSTELASGADAEVAITGADAIFNPKMIRNPDNNKVLN